MNIWLYNLIESKYRSWKDFTDFGFISAGHGNPASKPLKNVEVGDYIYVYTKPKGYFAFGLAKTKASLPKEHICSGEFVTLQDGSPVGNKINLEDLILNRPHLTANQEDPKMAELVVGVVWKHEKSRKKSVFFDGMQIPESSVVKAVDEKTIVVLRKNFVENDKNT